ncbi:hypothetical protein KSP40_PGU022097 [Platanthera guangdongensis]|uniref:Retrotransposon gag domain-containing protein n=1 Tax=Platanthera guangdongensis TaxID=2320717 RepID=A0ABR2N3F9_9ASPA
MVPLPVKGVLHNFRELAHLFVDQFIASRQIVRDPSHLSVICKNEGESLRDFFRRFTNEARQIAKVDSELLHGVFLGGHCPSRLYYALMRETVTSYADLMHRVEAQIAADEAIEAHHQQFKGSSNGRGIQNLRLQCSAGTTIAVVLLARTKAPANTKNSPR